MKFNQSLLLITVILSVCQLYAADDYKTDEVPPTNKVDKLETETYVAKDETTDYKVDPKDKDYGEDKVETTKEYKSETKEVQGKGLTTKVEKNASKVTIGEITNDPLTRNGRLPGDEDPNSAVIDKVQEPIVAKETVKATKEKTVKVEGDYPSVGDVKPASDLKFKKETNTAEGYIETKKKNYEPKKTGYGTGVSWRKGIVDDDGECWCKCAKPPRKPKHKPSSTPKPAGTYTAEVIPPVVPAVQTLPTY